MGEILVLLLKVRGLPIIKTIQIILISFICVLSLAAKISTAQVISQELIFLHTADVHGSIESAKRDIQIDDSGKQLEVVGGITRIASVIKNIEQENISTPVISLSSGDDLMGKFFNYFDGNATLDLMSQAGYDILTLGNHEFDRGPEVLSKVLRKTDIKSLCSDLAIVNTVLQGSCLPYYIETYGSTRVGFFSLMTEEFSSVTNGENVQLKDSNLIIAKQMVQLLKEQGADLIVAVTHIGIKQDRILAATVAGIDIIFGGHSHILLDDYEQIGQTLLLSGGEKGDALLSLKVSLDQNSRIIKNSIQFRLIPITEDIVEDEAIKMKLSSYQQEMPAEVVLGKTDTHWDLRKETIRSKESTVADLVNDRIREKFNVDIVLNNSGAFRSNKEFAPGLVTDAMLREIDKFENDIYLVKIKGHYLKEILEHSANRIGSGGFLQVSGIRYTINSGGKAQIVNKDKESWSVENSGEKISNIEVVLSAGVAEDLEPNKIYSIACNAFLVEKMGDGYFWFKQYGSDLQNTYLTIYSVLMEAFHINKTINIPDSDGRISFIQNK